MATAPEKVAADKPPAETETSTARKTEVIKYVGTANVREIMGKDWSKIDVEDQGVVRWSKDNKWTVPVADLKPGAVKYLDQVDSGFVRIEV